MVMRIIECLGAQETYTLYMYFQEVGCQKLGGESAYKISKYSVRVLLVYRRLSDVHIRLRYNNLAANSIILTAFKPPQRRRCLLL